MMRAQDIKEGDDILYLRPYHGRVPEFARVTKNVWNGHSRTERRIEIAPGYVSLYLDHDVWVLVVPA